MACMHRFDATFQYCKRKPLKAGRTVVTVDCHSASVPCRLERILEVTKAPLPHKGRKNLIGPNVEQCVFYAETVRARFVPLKPLHVESEQNAPDVMSRIILRDDALLLAHGRVQSVEYMTSQVQERSLSGE